MVCLVMLRVTSTGAGVLLILNLLLQCKIRIFVCVLEVMKAGMMMMMLTVYERRRVL